MQGEKVGLLLMGQACVSVNSRMGEQSDKRPWCDRSKDGLRHPQLQTPHDVMRRMTVTAATCSSRSLLPCNIRVRAVGVAQPEQSPALWIDSAGVAIRDIAGMLIAMYARNNVPHFAWLRVCNTVGSSAISQLSDMVARLSRRSIEASTSSLCGFDFVEHIEANDPASVHAKVCSIM